MTVQNTIPYEKYITNGSDSIYTLSYYVEDKDNLLIKLDDTVVSKNEYSYIKSSNAVQFNTTLSANQKLEIFRKTKLERTTNYESFNNTFRPEVLNKDLDKIWLNLQEQSYKVNQYDYDYGYAVSTANQALQNVTTAQQKADDAYNLADTTNTEIRPITRGGTGSDNKEDARENLDVHSKAEVLALIQTGGEGNVVPVSSGGTGAATAEEARLNLDVYSKSEAEQMVPSATTAVNGIVRLATDTDVTNISETVAITPKGVSDMLVGVGASAKGFRALLSARLTEMTGTNSVSGRTITCTITAHGLSVGDVIRINYRYKQVFGDAQATDVITVTSVTSANVFVFTTPQSDSSATGSLSGGTCNLSYVIKNKNNINSLTINSIGRYTIALNTASGINGTSFIPFVAATSTDNTVIHAQPEVIASATSLTVRTFDLLGASIVPQWLHIGITQ